MAGDANGQLQGGASFNGNGQLVLDGSTGYVDLPDGIIAGLQSATFVSWFSYNGGNCGQRIFDFGSDVGSFSLNTRNCIVLQAPNKVMQDAAMISYVDNAAQSALLYTGPNPLAADTYMMAVVIDANAMTVSWYVDGTLLNGYPLLLDFSLADANGANNWLGRSNTDGDAYFDGSLDEIRIYRGALNAAMLADILAAGPDALP